MMKNEKVQQEIKEHDLRKRADDRESSMKFIRLLLPVIVIAMIWLVLFSYMSVQRDKVVKDAEYVINQSAEKLAGSIESELDYAQSSIKLSAVSIAQTMTSDTLENPAEVILPMIESTPFGGIEYIRADGMNVMNIGEPFDARDRVYYIEGIKGNTGIWNNYHPKTSQETLMNFYTPLVYKGNIAGVLTGYIAATTQLASLLETNLYDKEIHGLLLDENDMVICSTIKAEFEQDLTLDRFMNRFEVTEAQRQQMKNILAAASEQAVSFKDPNGEGRICVTTIPATNWRVALIVPATSFNEIIGENTRDSAIAISLVSLILITYAAYVLIRNVRRRRAFALENLKLEAENRIFNEENSRAFAEIAEIRDIIAAANMGTWRIELFAQEKPRMYVDETMKELLGIAGQERTPEKTYADWFDHIKPEAVPSVLKSVERMQEGYFDENTYLWIHPTKGVRYVRCGGTSQKLPEGYVLRGYHYDVDDVVREDQAKVVMLENALNEKKAYYATLGALSDIYYSMHVIDLVEDSVEEFNAKGVVKEIVNRKQGAIEMMTQVMNATTSEEYLQAALEHTDLTTLADRMQNKMIISRQLVGKYTGWFLASFITMEADEEGRPTKVIYTTRIIDEEKKQEEKLIKKSQTDELTGFLNRRAYEEDIYAHNELPEEKNFIYVSLDVNGLKVVNDTLGHAAGDELLLGACQCMRKSLGSYGKLYRTGGDEFIAILFCDAEKVKDVFADFDDTMENWSGNMVESLSISYGWISREEEPEASVPQLGVIADQRMYEAKSAHYRKTGVDRRGQKEAHKALCDLYTKILKINITEDTYQIINMDIEEQTEEKGFANSISEWLRSFGVTGQVHPEDLQDYLKTTDLQYIKDYFATGKEALHIFYRRKYGEGYKRVMMEMIPANDYGVDDQNLFLYVKDMD